MEEIDLNAFRNSKPAHVEARIRYLQCKVGCSVLKDVDLRK